MTEWLVVPCRAMRGGARVGPPRRCSPCSTPRTMQPPRSSCPLEGCPPSPFGLGRRIARRQQYPPAAHSDTRRPLREGAASSGALAPATAPPRRGQRKPNISSRLTYISLHRPTATPASRKTDRLLQSRILPR